MKNLILFILMIYPLSSIAQKSTEYQSLQKQIDSLTLMIVQDSKFIGALDSIFYYYNDRRVTSRKEFHQYILKEQEFRDLQYRIRKQNLIKTKYKRANIYIHNIHFKPVIRNHSPNSLNPPIIIRGQASLGSNYKPLYVLTVKASRKNKKALKKERAIYRDIIKKGNHFELIIPNSKLQDLTPKKIKSVKLIKGIKDIRKYNSLDALNGIVKIRLKAVEDFLDVMLALKNINDKNASN